MQLFEWTSKKAATFQFLGTLSLPFCFFFIEPVWFLVILPVFLLQSLMTTVALHRLFVHSAYECKRHWHYIMGFLSCLSMTSSPLQWAVAHYTHHKYSDTDKDPHNNSLAKYFGVAYFTKAEYDFTRARKLMRDPLHQFLHRYYFVIHIAWAAFWFLIGGWEATYCAWIVPAVMSMWIGAHHTSQSHKNGKPINMSYIFSFVYLGEHLHRDHHSRPRLLNYATEKGQLDIGYHFIKMIRNESKN